MTAVLANASTYQVVAWQLKMMTQLQDATTCELVNNTFNKFARLHNNEKDLKKQKLRRYIWYRERATTTVTKGVLLAKSFLCLIHMQLKNKKRLNEHAKGKKRKTMIKENEINKRCGGT